MNQTMLSSLARRAPSTIVSIRWEVDGASGRTDCLAAHADAEKAALRRAGYQVIDVNKA